MKRSKFWLLAAVLVLVLTGAVGLARAASETQMVRIGDDLFIAGQGVTVSESVPGDVYAAGQSVTIKGDIGGDLLVGAQSVTVDGNVGGSIRGGAQMVNINGSVGKSVMIGAQDLNLNQGVGAKVKNVAVGAATVTIGRPVDGYLLAGGQTVNLDKSVAGDVRIGGQTVTISQGATIGGQVDYYSQNVGDVGQAALEKAAPGRVTWHQSATERSAFEGNRWWSGTGSLGSLTTAFMVIVFGLAVYWVFPQVTTGIVVVQRQHPVLTVLFGLLFLPLIIILAILLGMSIVLAPLAVLLVLAVPYAFILGAASVYQNLGQALTSRRGERRGWAIVLGGLVFAVLHLIPIIGAVVSLVVIILGTGGITVALLQRVRALPG